MSRSRLCALIFAITIAACDGGETDVDASVADASGGCASACDDGVFCNGLERCEAGACVAGPPACALTLVCDEAAMRCADPMGCADDDGDGHTATACGGDDCDDADATRFPGNTEVCDARGHDEDCDPSTIGGSDEDGDGHVSVTCCNAQLDGALLCGDDCDPNRGSVHPGVTDDCNLTDDDCDGAVDEDPPTIFYRDLDGDGFGRPGDPDDTTIPAGERPVRACGGGPGFSALDTDCDDAVRMINPAAPEVCADGVDNNCDAIEDADPSRPGFSCACTVLGEERACGGGMVNAPPAICRAGVQTCQVGGTWSGCSDDVAAQTERCNEVDDDCDGEVDEAVQITCYADPDNDGFAEAGSVARELCAIAGREEVGGCPILFTDLEPLDADSTDCAGSDASLRPGALDRCNLLDDDCDGAVDEGPSDAGCTDANGWGLCRTGQCVGLACRFGRGDCDGLDQNGCETSLLTSDAHCGGCGLFCPLGAHCQQGVCVDGFVKVSAGRGHACAIATDGSLYCWGNNDEGQIGDGTSDVDRSPTRVSADFVAVDVAVSETTTCAVSDAGEVWCWGPNFIGVAGHPPGGPFLEPTLVSGVSGAVEVVLGYAHGCARTSIGEVYCWGSDAQGQRGDGATAPDIYSRSRVPSLSGVVDIASGRMYSCALLDTGDVRCWGTENFGELGDGGTSGVFTQTSPRAVSGIADAIAIEAGEYQTCAVRAGGTLWCWGANDSDRPLGLATFGHQHVPVEISGVTGVAEVGMGDFSICARTATDALYCWGRVLLDDSTSYTPRAVTSLGTPRTIAAGYWSVFVVNDRGTIVAAGRNEDGQLGGPGLSTTLIVMGTPYLPAEVRLGSSTGRLVRSRNGAVSGANVVARAVATSGVHHCAALPSGQVACWGRGFAGELGYGMSVNSPTPVLATGIADAWQVTAANQFSCALHQSGTVSCWGSNTGRRLGVTGPSGSNVPIPVPSVTDGVEIASGTEHTCVRRSDGRVMCWGENDRGQLGIDSTAANAPPTLVPGLSEVVAISADGDHSCAVLASGEMRCWGDNQARQLGSEGLTESRVPITVVGVSGPIAVGGGLRHQCVIEPGGRASCWGSNADGQLGASTPTTSADPLRVPGIFGARQIDGGETTTCVVQSAQVICWGNDAAPAPIAY